MRSINSLARDFYHKTGKCSAKWQRNGEQEQMRELKDVYYVVGINAYPAKAFLKDFQREETQVAVSNDPPSHDQM